MKTTCMMVTILISLMWLATASAMDVKLQWDPNTESDLAGYRVYYGTDVFAGPVQLDVANQTVATISSLDPAQNYSFAVVAYNTSGLESSYSNIVAVAGSNSLTTAVTAPANNATVSGIVSVAASASDAVGVTKVEFYVNGILQATDTVAPYVYSWNTSVLASGTYTLMTKAYNAAGNVSQSSNVMVSTVNDTTAPTVSLTAPGNSSTLSGTVAITASASDNIGVSKVEFYSNGTLLFAGNVTPYTYNWNTASVANGSYTLTAKAYDNAGNIGQSSSVLVTVLNNAAAPTVTAFTMPTTASSTVVTISSFTATDNTAVTGYLVTETAAIPAANAVGWSASVPASFTFSSTGVKTAYAWAKNAAGIVSVAKSCGVTITTSPSSDTTAPVINTFGMPATSSSLTVAVSSFTASDAVGVTGYMVTENFSTPTASAVGWTAAAPTSFVFSSAGSKTALAWVKDAAGNVSSAYVTFVTIKLSDSTAPIVSTFTMPLTATSLNVAISSFAASDNIGVTGYLITESATAPSSSAAGWLSSVPTLFTFSTAGIKTAYAWVMDAAGNVSVSRSATVTITLPVEPPVLTVNDALTSLQIAVGTVQATSDQKTRLDVAPYVNGISQPDGKIDIGDVIVILGKVTGKIAM